MIQLKCTQCGTLLELDDGFAGGTCRCSRCGTIQTVPRSAPRAATAGGPATGRPTPQPRSTDGGSRPASSLHELAEVVTSSGIAGSGLGRGDRAAHAAGSKPASGKGPLPLVLALVGVAVAVGVGLWLSLGRGDGAAPGGAPSPGVTRSTPDAGAGEVPPSLLSGPRFGDLMLGVPKTVAYVVDRGSGSNDYFASLKSVLAASVGSLPSGAKFAVCLWDNGNETPEGMPVGAQPANEANRRALSAAFDRLFALGSSDPGPALDAAFAADPDVIVIITPKGWQLDDGFVADVLKRRGGKPIKIHAISLGGSDGPSALKTIAEKTGGEYRAFSTEQLRRLTR
jgi:hypothetical protein